MMAESLVRSFVVGSILIIAASAAALGEEGAETGAKPPPGGTPWSQKDFVHPPLKCLAAYTRIDEFPISAWCFHGDSSDPAHPRSPYSEDYVRNAKAIGFNVLIDDDRILPYARKVGGVKVQLAKLWLNSGKLNQQVFSNPQVGDDPLIQGIVMGDNGRGFGSLQTEVADWLKKNYPYVAPIMSMYPARMRTDTAIRIWHMQNYPFMRGRSSNPPTHYMTILNSDRLACNANDMALFECYAGDASFSRIRFQMTAAMAYGAQGLSNFCYAPHKMPFYQPGNRLVPHWKKLHVYVIGVLGRHLWGTRCIDVIHSEHGGQPPGAPAPGPERLVTEMSDFLLAGLLTPEAKFLSKDPKDKAVPEYFLVVDKRTGGETPEARDVYVKLSPQVAAVELLDYEATGKAGKVRKIVPACKVRASLEGGEALLLRVSPDLEKLLGGPEGMKLYAEINAMLANDAAAAARAKAKAGELKKVLDAGVAAGTLLKPQAEDTLARLTAAIDAAAAQAK